MPPQSPIDYEPAPDALIDVRAGGSASCGSRAGAAPARPLIGITLSGSKSPTIPGVFRGS